MCAQGYRTAQVATFRTFAGSKGPAVLRLGFQQAKEGVRQKRRSYREPDDDEDASGDDLAAVNERLDALTRQLERMAQANAEPRRRRRRHRRARRSRHRRAGAARSPPRSGHSRKPHRRESNSQQRRHDTRRRRPPRRNSRPPQLAPPPPPPPRLRHRGPANWAAQISARQRALDGEGVPSSRSALPQLHAPRRATRELGRRIGPHRPGAAAPPHQHADFVAASALRERARRAARAIWPRSGGP